MANAAGGSGNAPPDIADIIRLARRRLDPIPAVDAGGAPEPGDIPSAERSCPARFSASPRRSGARIEAGERRLASSERLPPERRSSNSGERRNSAAAPSSSGRRLSGRSVKAAAAALPRRRISLPTPGLHRAASLAHEPTSSSSPGAPSFFDIVVGPDTPAQPPRAGFGAGVGTGSSPAAGPSSILAGHLSDNNWTSKFRALSVRAMADADRFAWMYEWMGNQAHQRSNRLRIITGILGGILGTKGAFSCVYAFTEGEFALASLGAVETLLGLAVTVCMVLTSVWNVDELQNSTLMAHVRYSLISRSITYQLALKPQQRQDGHRFVEDILKDMENLKLLVVGVDPKAEDAYKAAKKMNAHHRHASSFRPPPGQSRWGSVRRSVQRGDLRPPSATASSSSNNMMVLSRAVNDEADCASLSASSAGTVRRADTRLPTPIKLPSGIV